MWRLRGPAVARVVRGAYLEAAWADDLQARCAAVLQRYPQACISHWTAVVLLGLPAPQVAHVGIHVTVPPGVSRPRARGVVPHEAAWLPVVERSVDDRAPARMTGPVRSWCDAAALSSAAVRSRAVAAGDELPDLADLVAVGDVLAGRRKTFRRDVGLVMARRPGGRGTARVRAALALVDGRSESPPETRLRVVLSLAGLPPEAVQHEVRRRGGGFVARVDLAWPSRRLAVEFDGDHHRGREQWRSDLGRREALELQGWVVLVVTSAQLLRDPDGVVARVRHRLTTRATA